MSAELMFFKPVDQREETTHRLTPKVRSDGFSSCLVGSDPNAWKRLFAINVQTTLKKARSGAVSSPCAQNAFLRLNFDFVPDAG